MSPTQSGLANLCARRGTFRFKTIAQGAATSVLVATSPQLEGIGGRYFEDCNEAGGARLDSPGTGGDDPGNYRPLQEGGVAAYALDHENAEPAVGGIARNAR